MGGGMVAFGCSVVHITSEFSACSGISAVGKNDLFFTFFRLELVQESLAESKTTYFSPFFTFFQLRSTGYAPSKM
jgi:hypothetical protein